MRGKPSFALLAFLASLLGPASPVATSAAAEHNAVDIGDLVRRAVANQVRREPLRNDYTYLAHFRSTDFPVPGRWKPHYTDTFEIMFLEGSPYARHVAHNERPLTPEQTKLEEALLQAEAKARKAGSTNRAGWFLGYPSAPLFDLRLLQHLDQFDLQAKGKANLDGRLVLIVEAVLRERPDPSASAPDYGRYFKITLWIDAAETQIVQAREELIQDGLVIVQPTFALSYPVAPGGPQVSESATSRTTYERGAVFVIQWTKVNDDAWLPSKSHCRAKGKAVVEKPAGEVSVPLDLRFEIEATYSGYKKFRVKTRIVP